MVRDGDGATSSPTGRRTCRDRFRDVARETNTAVSDNRNTRTFQRFNRVRNGSDLWNTHTGNDTGRTDGARTNSHFDSVYASFKQRTRSFFRSHIACN